MGKVSACITHQDHSHGHHPWQRGGSSWAPESKVVLENQIYVYIQWHTNVTEGPLLLENGDPISSYSIGLLQTVSAALWQ